MEEAIALEKRWKIVHQKRKSIGLITGWAAYTIFNDYKSESIDFDYISVNASTDLNTITQYPDEMGAALIKEDPSLYNLITDTEKVQSVIRNKITKSIEWTGASNDLNSLLVIETIQPTKGNNSAYLDYIKK
jgi:hypothetical protein